MTLNAVWEVLSRKLGSKPSRWPAVALQPVGFVARDINALLPVLQRLGELLALNFELHDNDGEIVLLDADYVGRTPSRMIDSLKASRPTVIVEALGDDESQLSAARTFERCQRELLRQLKEIALLRARSERWGDAGWAPQVLEYENDPSAPDSGLTSNFDSEFDSEFDTDQLASEPFERAQRDFVQQVLRGLFDAKAPPLGASYGPCACMWFNFSTRFVTIDSQAQQMLRVWRQLPPVISQAAEPSPDAISYELDETVWHLGVACGDYALLDEPTDWWHTPLECVSLNIPQIERYTRQPRHLALASRLIVSPVTPSDLRRHVRISIVDLRRFLQACLFLGLIRWSA